MKSDRSAGMTLVELLVAMAIASITGTMVLQMAVSFQSRILAEISRNDLQDRAERLIRFIASDIGDSAFLLGAKPQLVDGSSLQLVHDSLPGDPVDTLPSAIIPEDVTNGNDRLTIVKAESFSPKLRLLDTALSGEYTLVLNRVPNRSPGSTREIQPAPEAINHLMVANHRDLYAVQQVDQILHLFQPLAENVPAETEVLGVRAYTLSLDSFVGSCRLRRDDFTSRNILDDNVDGLQFEFLLADGSLASQPLRPQEIRAVKISLLVRALYQDRNYTNTSIYALGNRTYGPFLDHFRRYLVSRLVEVKNHGLQ